MPKFAGGVSVDNQGYLVIKAGPHRDRRVHEMIAEAILGRELKKDEQAHHINGNKLDCDWRNIKVLGIREHGAVSARQAFYFKQNDIEAKREWDEFWAEANNSIESHADELLGDDAEIEDTINSARAEADVSFDPEQFTSERDDA